MEKLLKRFKNIYLNRTIAFIVLEVFLISTIQVYPNDTNNNNNNDKKDTKEVIKNITDNIKDSIKKDDNEKVTLKISYTFDIEKDVLYITWNRSLSSGKKYYVFKKEKDSNKYKLTSEKEGIEENFYVTTLKENVGASFVVCENPELPKIPNDVKIYSPYDMGDYVGLFKKLKGSEYTESNVIEIKLDKEFANIDEKEKYAMNKEDNSKKDEEKKNEETINIIDKNKDKVTVNNEQDKIREKKPVDEKLKEKLEKVNEEIKGAWGYVVRNKSNNKTNKSSSLSNNNLPDNLHPINNNGPTEIEQNGIRAYIPANSAPPDSYVYIYELNKDGIINTPADSINITKGDGKGNILGYDVSLLVKSANTGDSTGNTNNKEGSEYLELVSEDGKYVWKDTNKFINDIEVSIKYDENNIPNYVGKGSGFIYYFDENEGKWVSLSRTNLDTKSKWVSSKTDHFCQFYAGTMNVQNEPPQAKGINTNPINIQAIDPMAGIIGVAPPSPNNQGTANVSYPIGVPEGINGLTPKVSINYSSEGKEGDCGYGWSLGTSKIEIDTKRGVPKYDGIDKLLFDGKEIVNVGSNVYRFKVEGGFSKIVKGSNNSFVVYSTDGTTMYYGENENSRAFNPENVSQIFKWYLTRVVDKFGNQMSYEYLVNAGNRYLNKIKYGYENAYTVNFIWATGRVDKRESYISGFLVPSDLRLANIDIKYKEKVLKTYKLTYQNGAFNKSILTNIQEVMNGNVLNDNSFTYDTAVTSLFGGEGLLCELDTDRYNLSTKDNIGQFFIDLNGDGLTDLIQKDIGYTSPDDYSSKVKIDISLNNSSSFNAKSEWYSNNFPVLAGSGPTCPNDVYFTDTNGDGLSDLYYLSSNYYFHLNSGKNFQGGGFKVDYFGNIGGDNQSINNSFVDINGDGCSDELEITTNYSSYDRGSTFVQSFSISCSLNKGIDYFNSKKLSELNSIFLEKKNVFSASLNNDNEYIGSNFNDINGDGLNDFVVSNRYNSKNIIYNISINKGLNFKNQEIAGINNATDYYRSIVDINGDGIGDLISNPEEQYVRAEENNDKVFYINCNIATGSGYIGYGIYKIDSNTKHKYENRYICFADINGDGYQDLVRVEYVTKTIDEVTKAYWDIYVSYNQCTNKNILKTIKNNKTGVESKLNYQYTFLDPSRATTKNYKKKFVLSSVETKYQTLSYKTDITYSKGIYDRLEKEFRGFENVTTVTYDTAKNIPYKTETIYEIDNTTGADEIGNPKYDQYYKGQVLKSTSWINAKLRSMSKNEYTDKVIANNVKFVYSKKNINSIYNDAGQLQADVITTSEYTIDANGLISQSIQISEADPNHTNDNVKTITNYSIDSIKWLCLPINTEVIDLKNNSRISYKTVEYYDNGSVKKEQAWNNEGADPITEYQYDLKGNVIEIRACTDENPTNLTTKTETSYIADDNIYKTVKATSPDGLTTTTKFDIYGRGFETTDIYGDTSTMGFDDYGRVITITEIVNEVPTITKTFTYSKEGEYFKAEASYLDNAGGDNYIKMQFYKDGLGRNVQTKKESVVNGDKCWVVSGWIVRDLMGRAIEQGVPTIAIYSQTGYVNNQTDSLKIKTKFEYDSYGRFYKATMPNGYWVTKNYDVIKESYYNSITNSTENRIVAVSTLRDIEGRESIEYTDLGGAVVRTEVKKNSTEKITTKFEYDLHGYGKVIESTGAIGEKKFNSLGGLMWMKSPDAGKFEYVYNNKLLVTTVKDYGKNVDDGVTRVINYTYDEFNRMIGIEYSGFGNNDIQYEYYDSTGGGNRYARSCIKKITRGDYFAVEYDFGQLWIDVKKRIENSTYTTKFTYDVQGRIDNVLYPDGEEVKYSYDEGGYLTSIKNNTGSQFYISDIKYNKYGQRIYLKYGNGVETNYTYTEETGLLNTMKQTKGVNELINYDYDFDLTGNLKKLTDNPNNNSIIRSLQSYTYDPLGRITSADGNYKGGEKTYNEIYTFDNDNRIIEKRFKRDNGTETSYIFNYENTDHAIRSINITGSTNGETRVDFNYNDFGNMTKKTILKNDNTSSITEFKYDETNKLYEIILPNDNKHLEFKYDNGGQRITKEVKDGCTTINKNVYVNGFYEKINDAVNKHISDGQYIFATILDNNYDNIIYYSQNNIGSTTLLTNNNGDDIGQFLYTPFGEMWVEEASTVDISHITRFFTNQQYDKESGLYYMNARYYDPHLGSFITPDPGMDGLNHYAYCSAKPITYSDPTGLDYNDESTDEVFEDSDLDNENYEENNLECGKTILEAILDFFLNPFGGFNSGGSNNNDTNLSPMKEFMRRCVEAYLEDHGLKSDPKSKWDNDRLDRLVEEYKNNGMLEEILKEYDIDNFFKQTDQILKELAKELEKLGLDNPARWACYFMSCMRQVAEKTGMPMSRKDLISIAREAFGEDSPNFTDKETGKPKDTLGNEFFVGDAYNLMNIAMAYQGFDCKALSSSKDKADFSIIKYTTSLGFHYAAGYKNGKEFYNPDPNVKVTNSTIMYFQWSK